ncbi:MAG: class I SAM-dependent methyltransferase [Balneolaceae bacterium]
MPKISYTAAYITVKFYGLTKDSRIADKFDSFTLDFYKKMVGFLPSHLSWYQNSLNSSFLRRLFIWSEELLLPGDLMHIICRKYYITKLVREAIDQGVEQIVSMGAGFDHLGLYCSSLGIPSFEMDMESMIENKSAFIQENEYSNSYLNTLAANFLDQRLTAVLSSEKKFNSRKKTLFIGEGFFDYLPLETTKEILEDIKSLNRDNQLLTTFFSLDELNWFHRFSFTSGVSLVGESLRLPLNRSEFISLLKEFEFSITKEIGYKDMENDLVSSMQIKLPVLKGFYVMNASIKN